MYGAIIGDLIGSIYEYDEFIDSENKIINLIRRREILTKEELIDVNSFYSDDTILTIAILDSILNNKSYEDSLKEYCLKTKDDTPNNIPYFKYMFSPMFIKWCNSNESGTSIGNGAMMRISPVGYLFNTEEEVLRETIKATIPSHNSSLAIKSAEMVAYIIYLARKGINKQEVYDLIQKKYNVDTNFSLEKLQQTNTFDSTCKILSKLLFILFNSLDFEDCMRKVVSIGGDTDTNACIIGSMAEAIYSIPPYLIEKANEKLPDKYKDLLKQGYSKIKKI